MIVSRAVIKEYCSGQEAPALAIVCSHPKLTFLRIGDSCDHRGGLTDVPDLERGDRCDIDCYVDCGNDDVLTVGDLGQH